MDFSGSGTSGGDHVTLGCNEKDDLRAVVNYLRTDGNVSLIGLWGRSMGAVTSLMYGAEDPSIAGMVLDSPFSDLVDLMMELVDTYKVRLPKFTVKFAIQYMRKLIQKKAKFDIMDLNTVKAAKSCYIPALIGHAIDDDFICPHHSDRILEAYMGDKSMIKFEGDHNSPRPQFYFDSINIFFHNVLQPPEDEVGESFFDIMNGYFGKDIWRSVHELGWGNEPSSEDKEPSRSSIVDADKQVHSRRPMNRMKEEKCDELSSSSTMISFELSDGHLYDPSVPTTSDNDRYVEFQLDDLAGFPSNANEEEKMLTEAVVESLKDREMKNPLEEQPPCLSSSAGAAPPSSPLDTSSVTESGNSTESASACSDNSSSLQSSSDTDISHHTKATLTVIRNPSSHVMNGLMRRWDFNFFRNCHNR